MTKLYGVSSGNGNDGVSHMFPNYYVRTDKPWTLAQAAMLAEFKPGKGQAFALDQMEIDGEEDYTIAATILDPPNEDGEEDLCDDGSSWSETNGAWLIVEVFPVDEPAEEPGQYDTPIYATLEDCFGAEIVTLCDKG